MCLLTAPSSQGFSLYDFPLVMDEVRKIRNLITAAINKGGTRSACEAIARASGGSIGGSTLQKKLRDWLDSGQDDTVLIDKRKFSDLWQKTAEDSLPEEFLIWAGGQMLGNQRKSAPAHRQIIARWRAWRRTGEVQFAIPGYRTPPKDCGKGYPIGWSYKNLMQRAQPPKEELAMARIGSVAAQRYLPFIPGTRADVKFLQFVFCDDVRQDRQCIVPGFLDPVPILQLGALDYASAVYLKFGIRPDVPRDDGTRERLQRRDFLTLIAGLLMDYGFPMEHIMHIVCERGTATMNLAEAQFLYELSNGQIRVGYTSMEGRFVLAWDEAKSGNAQGKGPLESWHNLFHNEMGSLPGQLGKDRDHSPAALLHSNREVTALNKLSMILAPQQRARIVLPYPTLAQAHKETLAVVERINHRRDHQLEDFDDTALWRLKGTDMEWRPEGELLTLPDPNAALSLMEWLPVKEKPVERLARLSQGVTLTKPHPGALVGFFEASHSVCTVERRQVKVKVKGKNVWFGPESADEAMANGEQIMVHHMPTEPEWAIITHKGKYVGTWRRQLISRADEDADAVSAQVHRKQSFIKQTAAMVRGRMAEQLLEHERRVTNNAEVLAESGLSASIKPANLATDGGIVTSAGAVAVQELKKRTARIKKRQADDAKEAREAAEALNAVFSPTNDNENETDDTISFTDW